MEVPFVTVAGYLAPGPEGGALFFMPRTSRIVIPEIPHHATQRGHNRQAVFFVDDDRRATQPADPEKIQQPDPQGYGYIHCNSITSPPVTGIRFLSAMRVIIILRIGGLRLRSRLAANLLFFLEPR
jgi:hypothetical protein